ncbi:MAG: hypothetical protein JW946_05990 [Candidatus Omnitrophica bacterium]|nr:hypothetical protein [Candidatus Omnitrophota bacterium]
MNTINSNRRLLKILCLLLVFVLVCNNANAALLTLIVTTIAVTSLIISASRWGYTQYQNLSARIDAKAASAAQQAAINERSLNPTTPEQQNVLERTSAANTITLSETNAALDKLDRNASIDLAIDTGKAVVGSVVVEPLVGGVLASGGAMSRDTGEAIVSLTTAGIDAYNGVKDNFGKSSTERSPDINEAIQRTKDMKRQWGTEFADDAASEEAYWQEREKEKAGKDKAEKDKLARESRTKARMAGAGRVRTTFHGCQAH